MCQMLQYLLSGETLQKIVLILWNTSNIQEIDSFTICLWQSCHFPFYGVTLTNANMRGKKMLLICVYHCESSIALQEFTTDNCFMTY